MQDAPLGWLADIPTGPELGAALAPLRPRDASDLQLHDLLAAQSRQLNFAQAQLWETMAELATRDPMLSVPGKSWTPDQVFDSAVAEVRAELRLTRRAAEREVANAAAVGAQHRIASALNAGAIDRARAITLADACWGLTEEQVPKLLDAVLPGAGQATATQLNEQVQKIAIALDPTWAERRYKQAVRERRVVGYLNRDGSATVSGQNLPADEAAAACARVDSLASAAKRAGAQAPIDHLRAELFLGLLDGRLHGLSEPDIIATLVRRFPKCTPSQAEPDSELQAAPASRPSPAARTSAQPRGVELRVRLGTLLGVTDEPAEIAGWGPVAATVARKLTAQQHKSEWRFAVVDDDGQVVADGITRRRPDDQGNRTQAVGGIVELHVPVALLTDTTIRDQHPEWSGVLTDLATKYERQAPIEQDPAARFAGRPLRRRTQIIFQRCIFPGCRRPASECDLDHRHDYARGGRTEESNLGPPCRHDHKLKTSGGWRLIRRDENTYVWISPLGRRHVVQREPIAPPLPAPMPRALPPDRWAADDDSDPPPSFQPRTRRGRPLAAAPAQPVTDRAVDPALDPPPF